MLDVEKKEEENSAESKSLIYLRKTPVQQKWYIYTVVWQSAP